MTDREKLIEEANSLSLEFKGNISNVKLQELVDEAKGPAVKPEPEDGADEPGEEDRSEGEGEGEPASSETPAEQAAVDEPEPEADPEPIKDVPSTIPAPLAMPAVAPGRVTEDTAEDALAAYRPKEGDSTRVRLRKKIQLSKAKALKLHVVTITNKDNRENSIMTTVPLSVENQHFGISRIVPLDVPVQIEYCLIEQAEATMMPHHMAEIVNGKPTGNMVTRRTKKFAVSYGQVQE